MSSNKIKVAGYSQRIFYDNGIEYRPFSENLVGNQFAAQGGTSLFTIGNFSITTNLDDKISKLFYTSNFSDFIDLNHLKFTNEDILAILTETSKIRLNLDKSDLTNYALFGSLTEYIRVSLENIILNWPASLLVSTIDPLSVVTGTTVQDYVYNQVTGISTFKIPTNRFINNFGINYLKNGNIINTFTNISDLRNITVNFTSYVISSNNTDFEILDFIGSDTVKDDFVYLTVKGDVFSGYVDFNMDYHIRPNTLKIEKYFKGLNDFESNLLNRFSLPLYTSKYKYTITSESGSIINSENTVTWPVSDGYNIDFQSEAYIRFVGDLLEIAENSDLTKTNLINRFFVSESITDFDTLPSFDNEDFTSGQKINSLLKIYGREFDEVKRYIDGIAFANVVSYDKKNNIPDAIIKNLARVMGWEVTSSILEIDLINNYLSVNNSSYSGHSVSLSPIEAEVELWRRIVLNTPWLWKSKGTRKAVEFLFKFIGTPDGLISFNEFIYVAEKSMDMGLFTNILNEVTDSTDLTGLNVDDDGYPRVQPNTPEMYFQKAGLWYRETAGPNSSVDILTGNNPHIGPYDGGQAYMNQFTNLIPNFSAVTIINNVVSIEETNIFTNYDNGKFDGVFNNDIVVSYNTQEWLDTLNVDIYDSIHEDLASAQIQPDYTTCSGVVDIVMNSYLDDVLVESETISGLVFSAGTISDSGLVLGEFITFLDNTIINLNSANTTNLLAVIDGDVYNIVDDILVCDTDSFYLDKRLDVQFETSFSYTCEGGDCNPDSLMVESIDDETGLVTFSNVIDNIVPSGDCCTNLGYEAVPTSGGFNCYTSVPAPLCSDYTPVSENGSGYLVFNSQLGSTTYVPSAQCCPIGTTAEYVNGEYMCKSNTTYCDDYIPSGTFNDLIEFSTPSGTTTSIPSSGCCPTNTTAIYNATTNGYNCKINCYSYTGYTFVDGVVVFEYSGGTFTDMPTYTCCPTGSTPSLTLDGNGQEVYICTEDSPPYAPPSFMYNTLMADTADCSKISITITGEPTDVVTYRIVINDNGNHGFNSTLEGDNNEDYQAMSTGDDNPPIIIPPDGEIILMWDLCAKPSLRVDGNCVDVSIEFYYGNTNVFTVNTFVCENT